MGHLHIPKEDVYMALARRLDKNPVGAPLKPVLIKILKHLYREKDADLGSRFPLMPSTLEDLGKSISMPKEELKKNLDEMADRGLVADVRIRDAVYYLLSPVVVGFFEYTFMRTDDRLPLKELARLFENYFENRDVVEEIFGAETKMFHTLAYEKFMPPEVETEVLSYEKASEIIRDAGGGGLSPCSCRHKALHLGNECDYPLDVCTSVGYAGDWLVSHNLAKPASADELLRVLEQTEKLGMVHLGDNVQKNPAYICHCCGCCCGVLRAIKEAGVNSIQPSNFCLAIDSEKCKGCGRCAESCHIDAIEITEEIPGDKKSRRARLKEQLCIGCGVCIDNCRKDALSLRRSKALSVPPRNKTEQLMRIAMEKGKLPE